MPVNVLQWRAGIGIFCYCSHPVIMNKFSHSNCFPKVRCVISYLYYFFCSLILFTHGDVKTDPGPNKSHSYFSCCHWNLNSLIFHNNLKVLCLRHIILYINMISFALVKYILILWLNQKIMISESMVVN